MQSIGGLVNNILVLLIFIYLIFLLHGKIKLNENLQEKFDNLMQRNGTLVKILVYAGAIIFGLLVLLNIFAFRDGRHVNNLNTNLQRREWTKADKETMTKSCIASAKNSFQKDSTGTIALCKCVTEKFTSKYTYEQAQELNKKPQKVQMDTAMVMIQSCKAEMKRSD